MPKPSPKQIYYARLKTPTAIYRAIIYCLILIFIYTILIFLLPNNSHLVLTHQLNEDEYKTALFLASIPIMLVWLVAFWGYARLSVYGSTIKETPEGKYYTQFSHGLKWLAWSLPISSIIDRFTNYFETVGNDSLHNLALIIGNYVNLALPLVAFYILFITARRFSKKFRFYLDHTIFRDLAVFVIFAEILFAYLLISKNSPTAVHSIHSIYKLPTPLLIITILIPYLISWILGISAAFIFADYTYRLTGKIYKGAVNYISGGLFFVVLGSIAVQYLLSLYTYRTQVVLNKWLIMNILFKFIIGLGFIMIAYGASQLKKIEDI